MDLIKLILVGTLGLFLVSRLYLAADQAAGAKPEESPLSTQVAKKHLSTPPASWYAANLEDK